MVTLAQEHWNNVYSKKASDEFSWYQPYPKTAMDFLSLFQLPRTANIIDVGGGDSNLVDALVEKGYQNIWVLDISAKAIERARQRLGDKAARVNWIVSDITDFIPPVLFDFWHDRAAFHFLTAEEDTRKYVSIAENAIRQNGYLVLGTFAENGPAQCSGLAIKQYSEPSMSIRFEKSFDRIRCVNEVHTTPSQNTQPFLFCSFRKK